MADKVADKETAEEKSKSSPPISQQGWWQPVLVISARFSSWIIFPLIVGLILGRWLDRKFHTDPWLFFGTIMLAFVISMIGLAKSAQEEYRKIEKEGDKGKKRK